MPSSSTTPPETFSIVPASPTEFLSRLEELITIHLRAMAYSESTRNQRRQLWRSSADNAGFACVLAISHPQDQAPSIHNPAHTIAGVAYGFTGEPHSWWYSQVRRGLIEAGLPADRAAQMLSNYSELAEIHVDPQFQGLGLGHTLLDHIVEHLTRPTIMLSTPEVPHEGNSAWQIYRSKGFTDLLRNFRFSADPRPFGILQLNKSTTTSP
ncbi:GNAT family N-acetyltransferase [Corynebacterium auriscanis]|uniref:GNAT family N-acetyltransferase n=1 Tax=Corynebacterium auriscanis TaxID=99807 RepID=UPI003CF9CE0C